MTLGERIKYRREKLGLTQMQLAEAAGLSRCLIYRYEADLHDPSLFNATCIADALGVSLDYLARGEQYAEKH
jgi:transcriptional regulator with XRE-family HTH domain